MNILRPFSLKEKNLMSHERVIRSTSYFHTLDFLELAQLYKTLRICESVESSLYENKIKHHYVERFCHTMCNKIKHHYVEPFSSFNSKIEIMRLL